MGWKYLLLLTLRPKPLFLVRRHSQLKKKPSVIEEINLNGLKVGAPVWGQKIKANLTLGSNTYKWDIYIAEMGDLCLLGLDFLHHHSIDIKLSSHSIEIKGEEIFVSLVKTPETSIKISRGHAKETHSSTTK